MFDIMILFPAARNYQRKDTGFYPSVRYNEDFKIEAIKAYMAGDRTLVELYANYNVAKSTIGE